MKYKIGIILTVIALLPGMFAIACSQTSTTSATDVTNVNSVSKKFANELSLSISVNPQLIKPGYPIHIVITESNMLSKMNHLRVSDKWPIKGSSDGICGVEDFPFGIALFQGDYTAANISTATPLILDNPNVIVQGCIPSVFNVTAYNFKSTSDIATLDGEAINGSATFEMSAEVTASLYWTGTYPNTIQQNFAPGIYTVVGGDEWGNLVLIHFTVTN
jgi:hypothetical protein